MQDHLGCSVVVPVAVHQQQPLDVLEPGDGEVRGHDCLHALLAGDAHPDVRGLDHAHVVGPVPDGERVLAQLLLHYPHQIGFLKPEKILLLIIFES